LAGGAYSTPQTPYLDLLLRRGRGGKGNGEEGGGWEGRKVAPAVRWYGPLNG